jgi:hypothetical protein
VSDNVEKRFETDIRTYIEIEIWIMGRNMVIAPYDILTVFEYVEHN